MHRGSTRLGSFARSRSRGDELAAGRCARLSALWLAKGTASAGSQRQRASSIVAVAPVIEFVQSAATSRRLAQRAAKAARQISGKQRGARFGGGLPISRPRPWRCPRPHLLTRAMPRACRTAAAASGRRAQRCFPGRRSGPRGARRLLVVAHAHLRHRTATSVATARTLKRARGIVAVASSNGAGQDVDSIRLFRRCHR
jgi:hypothetical protein